MTVSMPIPGKSSWPELLGAPERLAVKTIAHDRPDLAVEVIPPGTVVIPVVNTTRVRLWVDDNDLVSVVPIIG